MTEHASSPIRIVPLRVLDERADFATESSGTVLQ
jgi:hypothetical protein